MIIRTSLFLDRKFIRFLHTSENILSTRHVEGILMLHRTSISCDINLVQIYFGIKFTIKKNTQILFDA